MMKVLCTSYTLIVARQSYASFQKINAAVISNNFAGEHDTFCVPDFSNVEFSMYVN